jgi:hypothetical protein
MTLACARAENEGGVEESKNFSANSMIHTLLNSLSPNFSTEWPINFADTFQTTITDWQQLALRQSSVYSIVLKILYQTIFVLFIFIDRNKSYMVWQIHDQKMKNTEEIFPPDDLTRFWRERPIFCSLLPIEAEVLGFQTSYWSLNESQCALLPIDRFWEFKFWLWKQCVRSKSKAELFYDLFIV